MCDRIRPQPIHYRSLDEKSPIYCLCVDGIAAVVAKVAQSIIAGVCSVCGFKSSKWGCVWIRGELHLTLVYLDMILPLRDLNASLGVHEVDREDAPAAGLARGAAARHGGLGLHVGGDLDGFAEAVSFGHFDGFLYLIVTIKTNQRLCEYPENS